MNSNNTDSQNCGKVQELLSELFYKVQTELFSDYELSISQKVGSEKDVCEGACYHITLKGQDIVIELVSFISLSFLQATCPSKSLPTMESWGLELLNQIGGRLANKLRNHGLPTNLGLPSYYSCCNWSAEYPIDKLSEKKDSSGQYETDEYNVFWSCWSLNSCTKFASSANEQDTLAEIATKLFCKTPPHVFTFAKIEHISTIKEGDLILF
jgi:hypothetical protein